MTAYLITYMTSNTITVEADSEQEASDKFEQLDVNELLNDAFSGNGVTITDISPE